MVSRDIYIYTELHSIAAIPRFHGHGQHKEAKTGGEGCVYKTGPLSEGAWVHHAQPQGRRTERGWGTLHHTAAPTMDTNAGTAVSPYCGRKGGPHCLFTNNY